MPRLPTLCDNETEVSTNFVDWVKTHNPVKVLKAWYDKVEYIEYTKYIKYIKYIKCGNKMNDGRSVLPLMRHGYHLPVIGGNLQINFLRVDKP